MTITEFGVYALAALGAGVVAGLIFGVLAGLGLSLMASARRRQAMRSYRKLADLDRVAAVKVEGYEAAARRWPR